MASRDEKSGILRQNICDAPDGESAYGGLGLRRRRGANHMTIRNQAVPWLAGAILLTAMAAGAPSVSGQPIANSPPTTQTTPAPSPPAKPAAKTLRSAVQQNAGARSTQARPWSIEDALPAHSSAVSNSPTNDKAGRVPWASGTLGLEIESQVNPYQTPEARRLRSLEVDTGGRPSYLGFSLSVPTSDNLFRPTPLPLGQPQ